MLHWERQGISQVRLSVRPSQQSAWASFKLIYRKQFSLSVSIYLLLLVMLLHLFIDVDIDTILTKYRDIDIVTVFSK